MQCPVSSRIALSVDASSGYDLSDSRTRTFWRPISMWLVRLISILPLLVAMLLPPGMIRDCCCTRRAQLKRTEQAPVRACCRSKAKNAIRVASRTQPLKPQVTSSPCRCRLAVVPVATLVTKARPAVESGWGSDLLPGHADLVAERKLVSHSVHGFRQSPHLLGPPAQSMLCRWII